MEKMQAELARLDPRALDSLPKELKEALPQGLPKGLPGLGSGSPMPKLPGLPGLGGAPIPKFRGLPGPPGKKK
jgi:signal recognition particle subunit SRP54